MSLNGTVWSPIGPSPMNEGVDDNGLVAAIAVNLNNKNEVVSRPVKLGALHDGLRAIEDGLKSGERVIVKGLQLVRPGITVEPKLVDMPKQNPKSEARNPKQIQISKS
jgi:hypothetical protein